MELRGITVLLHELNEIGRDEFNAPVYQSNVVTVENVLVYPSESEDITSDSRDLHGKRIEYTLRIPKGDTHKWHDTQVEFFGEIWDTVGYPQEFIEELLPLSWNKKVKVCRHG